MFYLGTNVLTLSKSRFHDIITTGIRKWYNVFISDILLTTKPTTSEAAHYKNNFIFIIDCGWLRINSIRTYVGTGNVIIIFPRRLIALNIEEPRYALQNRCCCCCCRHSVNQKPLLKNIKYKFGIQATVYNRDSEEETNRVVDWDQIFMFLFAYFNFKHQRPSWCSEWSSQWK